MNIKKQIPRLISALLSFSIVLGNVIPAYATESITVEKPINDESNWVTDEGNFEEIEVTYKQASSFFVTIPKTIVLDGWKQAAYSVKVSGDIGAEQCVYVAPIDGIAGTDNIDFYMKDQASENKKEDVLAIVTQKKMHWNSAEAAKGYEQTDNLVSAPDLTAGAWKGIFQMEIKLETHSSHTHNYIESITKNPTCTEAGEKTYICDCGDSYTETIPATGHHYVDGECEHCGEKDPDAHTHSYTEKITKEPTCTEAGEKTYTCDCGDSYTEVIPEIGHHYGDDDKCTDCGELNPEHKHNYTETITKEPTCTEDGEKKYTCDCGDSYTEVIPATGHNYVDGKCEHCGEINDPYAIAPDTAYGEWDYTLDVANGIITLNYYKGSASDVIVYANYVIGGKTYKTQIKDSTYSSDLNGWPANYMFANRDNIKTIKFSNSLDTSNLTNMNFMFSHCTGVTYIDFGNNFDTSNVTEMVHTFSSCNALTTLDLSSFDTSNVTNMNNMFAQCYALAYLNVGSFNTSKVTNMGCMFMSCGALTSLDLSNFVTSNVTNMDGMFNGCPSLKSLNISNFDTSNVTNMSSMFTNCRALTILDLSSFDTKNVTNMNEMFYSCKSLNTIYVTEEKWLILQASRTSMFKYCGTSSVTYK